MSRRPALFAAVLASALLRFASPARAAERAPDHAGSSRRITAVPLRAHVAWLASDEREGRGPGTRGLDDSRRYIETAMKRAGLTPGGDGGGFDQPFQAASAPVRVAGAELILGRTALRMGTDFLPLAASDSGRASGLLAADSVAGKIALIMPGASSPSPAAPAVSAAWGPRLLELREKGAIGAIAVVDSLPRAGGPGVEYEIAPPAPGAAARPGGAPPAASGVAPGVHGGRPFVAAMVTREAWRRAFGDPLATIPADAAATLRVAISRRMLTLANVIGILPGADPALANRPVLVGAHYDHLGRAGDPPVVMNGADDNASGVAVLLETAAAMAREPRHPRPVWFIAFSGEEEGLVGSRWFVDHASFAPGDALAMVNMDTVGRPQNGHLLALGTGTSPDWPGILKAAGPDSGLAVVPVKESYPSSDQWSFQQRGVPAIQLFGGPNADYHRPTDDVDRIDFPALALVANATHDLVAALADRPAALAAPEPGAVAGTGTSGSAGTPGGGAGGSTERAWLGSVPDFAYEGPGVKLSGVSAGSPAEAAGLQAGDIITGIAGEPVESLADLTAGLRSHHAGEEITVAFKRDGAAREVRVTLKARP